MGAKLGFGEKLDPRRARPKASDYATFACSLLTKAAQCVAIVDVCQGAEIRFRNS
jgi:hypothetical protein